MAERLRTEVAVLGAGPGGYSAAFRAADLGKRVVLIERHTALGGVCLNVGCIPSKALLHVARVLRETEELAECGVVFARPTLDLAALGAWKDGIVTKLSGGLAALARQRKVQVLQGTGEFASPTTLLVTGASGPVTVSFEHCIIAAGSRVAMPAGLPDDARIMDSTAALALADVPERLLVIGGGIVGLEMATVYATLGSRVTIVEMTASLIPGCDADLVRPLQERLATQFEAIHLSTKVAGVEVRPEGLLVNLEGEGAPAATLYDRVLVAAGRRPNGDVIAAAKAGITVDARGFVPVDAQLRTNVRHLLAVGDLTAGPMLAHKASHQGKIAAEVAAGEKAAFDARTIPSVAYTDPEIAWTGLTERDAKANGIDYAKATFPWSASGRALTMGRSEGRTKLLFDKKTRRILGAGMVGPNAGELIAEAVLAIEMGADMQDLTLCIHPHPTLSETMGFAAEMAEGIITDLYLPRSAGC